MRKVACNFYTFSTLKKFSLRNAVCGIASTDCSRTKSIKVHALYLEAQYFGGTFSKAQKGYFSIEFNSK